VIADEVEFPLFLGKLVTEFGAAMNASRVLLGDKLGLYRTLAAKGPMNSFNHRLTPRPALRTPEANGS
jgi:hypothetical protein